MCFFWFSGSTSLYKTNNLDDYGILGQDTSLTCKEDTLTREPTDFTIAKDGSAFILDGYTISPTKHTVTINVGSIVLIIKNTSLWDEGEYTCYFGFLPESPPYHLKVKG